VKVSILPQWYCPVHQKPLSVEGDNLVCPYGEHFPCRGGIPRFVPKSNYAEAFGAQWKRYRLTQLDSYTKSSLSRDRTRRCIGEALWTQLAGKQVLECGCGAGRFTEILLNQGASVISLDLSEAVDANQENFPQSDTHRIAQADILQLPFAPQQFDVIFCLGVLQYTSNPEKALACLYEQVKPGGTLVVDIYTPRLSWYTKTSLLLRYYLRRLPPDEGMKWTEWLVDTFLPLHKMVRHFYPAQITISRLSPVFSYYHTYPNFSEELHREWALLDTHNALTGWYRHTRTRRQVIRSLQQLGLQEMWCEYGGNGVEARGKRPLV
jgi:2-polyprenyl-3-methyl-5-hydroxy-6-metoxy-1,4-benzoquinol methylase